jgi:hypothetical protein
VFEQEEMWNDRVDAAAELTDICPNCLIEILKTNTSVGCSVAKNKTISDASFGSDASGTKQDRENEMTCCSTHNWTRTSVAHRLEHYFQLMQLRCISCGDWHGDPEEFGIEDETDWNDQMSCHQNWILHNSSQVQDVLAFMEPDWSECCEVVREILKSASAAS